MCHHYDEARSVEERRARRRPAEADDPADGTPEVDATDDPAGETEESEPPAEPQVPADD